MKQYFSHYENWEDYKNGMYDLNTENSEEKIFLAKTLLCNPEEFYNTLQIVFKKWPIATKVNLTNNMCNRKAWTGQASCCYKYRVPETLTRVAWKYMTEEQRTTANKIADQCITEYENTLRNGNQNATTTEYQMKLPYDWNSLIKSLRISKYV